MLRRHDRERITDTLCEGIGNEPGDCLVHDFGLVVDALDREKDLAETMGVHDIQLPFGSEARTVFNEFTRKTSSGGKCGEKENHTKRVVDISESIDERRVSGNAI